MPGKNGEPTRGDKCRQGAFICCLKACLPFIWCYIDRKIIGRVDDAPTPTNGGGTGVVSTFSSNLSPRTPTSLSRQTSQQGPNQSGNTVNTVSLI